MFYMESEDFGRKKQRKDLYEKFSKPALSVIALLKTNKLSLHFIPQFYIQNSNWPKGS